MVRGDFDLPGDGDDRRGGGEDLRWRSAARPADLCLALAARSNDSSLKSAALSSFLCLRSY